MGLFDTLLGRTKPVKANLDALFALPTAALTLQSAGGPGLLGPRRRVLEAALGAEVRGPPGRGVPAGRRRLHPDPGLVRLRLAPAQRARPRRPGHPGPHGQHHPDRSRVGRPAPLLGVRLRARARRPRATPGPSRWSTSTSGAPSTRSRPSTPRRSAATPSSSCASAPCSASTSRWRPTWPAGSPCGTSP